MRDGATIVVGEIGPDEQQSVSLRFSGHSEGAFRLHFSASGWNAESGEASVAVTVGDGADMPAPVQRPPNDDFAMAMELDSMGGETTFDIVAATPDSGEPPYALAFGHPQRERSLWYVWTAPETGLARFTVGQSTSGDHSDYVVIDVYRDGSLASLETIGGGQLGGGSTFFANEGETYRVRLSIHSRDLIGRWSAMPDLTLGWGPGSRPENDDYAFAGVVEGASGTMKGTNQGATTQPAEYMGHSSPFSPVPANGWASSVWYRWTAPSTGDYRFWVNREAQVVAAFEGETLSAARMVSGIPARGPDVGVVFPATEGVEYHIGVATGSAYWAGSEFELSWAPGEREFPGNDDFASAAPTFGGFGFGNVEFNDLTVEHGEPAASGVRTAWWSWQAPADGRYTWLVNRIAGFIADEAPLQMAVFAGHDLASLEVVAMDEGDETMELQMAFDARADKAYRVAIGLPRDAAQVSIPSALLLMQWGPTPENDDFANAVALAGMSGSVRGSNEFATNEKGERTGSLGDSSLWWTFEPAESGWIRFELDGPRGSKLAIYRIGADGEMVLVRTSQDLGAFAATIHAEAGVRYVLRLGTYYRDADGFGGAQRGDFELSWGPSDPPALLRYVDSVADGTIAGDGSVVELEALGNQAFNADGTELYVASAAGILVFDRDPATGEVNLTDTLEDYPVIDGFFNPPTQMIWDEAGAALLVAGCDEWLKFTASADGGIEHAGSIDGAPCPLGDVLVEGDFVHHVMKPWLIETFRFDEGHDALSSAGVNMIPDVSRAAMTADGENIYAIANDAGEYSLIAMERDTETGDLRISTIIENGSVTGGEDGTVVQGLSDVRGLTVHGSHLFLSVGSNGADTLAFDLVDRANPAFLGNQPSFRGGFGSCQHPLARHDATAVDVACGGGEIFTVQVGADDSLFGSDLARGNGSDSFGNAIPGNDEVLSFGESPDGRHLYVAGSVFFFEFDPAVGFVFGYRDQLLVFERVSGG